MASIGLSLTSVVMLGCQAQVDGVPEGAVARVGDVVLEAELVEATHAQLDAFGQARFRGPDGRRALVDALIEQELLVQEARRAGLETEARVEWAVLEELANLQRAAMLERRLPRSEVAADTQALRDRHERERQRFVEPERRSMRVVRVDSWDQGEQAIEQLRSGVVTLEVFALGIGRGVVRTPLMKRDDLEFPAWHRALFDPALKAGDLVPTPVLSGQIVLVGEIDELHPSSIRPFDDPEVQEQLVTAEREARLAPVEAALDAELAARFVESAAGG